MAHEGTGGEPSVREDLMQVKSARVGTFDSATSFASEPSCCARDDEDLIMTDRDDRAQPIQYQVLMGNIRLCEYERGADFSIPDRISKDGVDDAVHILWNF